MRDVGVRGQTPNLSNKRAGTQSTKLRSKCVSNSGIINKVFNNIYSTNIRVQLNYSANWTKHSITAIAGIEQRESKNDGDG